MSIRRLVVALLVLCAGCHRRSATPPADPVLGALRAEEQAAGLTWAQGQGKHLFDHYCATCHGDAGAGDGQNASNLNPPPPDFAKSKLFADPVQARRVIVEGSAAVGRSPLSPPFGRTLSAQQIEYLMVYCKSLAARKP